MKAAYSFRFGTVFLEYEDEVLLGLSCQDGAHEISAEEYQSRTSYTDLVMAQILEYLEGDRQSFSFQYRLEGTDFQKQVWKAVSDISYGETRSYKKIAEAIGKPTASRAVGMANKKNPLLLVIPCHRVIGADGDLTGYAGGLEMKKYLLEMEGSQNHAAQNERTNNDRRGSE